MSRFSFSWAEKRADFWEIYDPWLTKTALDVNPKRKHVIEEWDRFTRHNMRKAHNELRSMGLEEPEQYAVLYEEGWTQGQAYKIVNGEWA